MCPSCAAVGLASSAAHAQVQYDETRIRQSAQITQVTGPAGGYLFFTISGYLSDAVA